MPRLPRVYIEGILYYVTSKGVHGQNIFLDNNDYNEYISLVARYKDQYGFRLFSYSLLPTHLHMLIELKNNVPISKIMHDVTSLYTKTFNGKYGKKGHLFQERFKANFCEKKSCLLQLARHIHLNPVRMGLVTDPKDYRYSSHYMFLDPDNRFRPDMRGEIEELFSLLKGRELEFNEYVRNSDQKEVLEFARTVRKNRILGSKDFEERLKEIIEEKKTSQKEEEDDVVNASPKKPRVLYFVISGAILLAMSVSMGYFYKQNMKLKKEYNKTQAFYEATLNLLKKERDKAMKTNQDIQKYAWKIKLTEEALEELKREKLARMELNGYTWNIKVSQIGGEKTSFSVSDSIYFEDNKVNSYNFSKEGFRDSAYTKADLPDGSIAWETIQANESGDRVGWRGEFDGKAMKGVFNKKTTDGISSDFSFVTIGERIKR